MAVHGINRRTRGQEYLDDRWGLSLSREMQRRPARIIGHPRGGTSGQEHPQTIRVPIGSHIVHRRPPQPIPIRHADHPHPARPNRQGAPPEIPTKPVTAWEARKTSRMWASDRR
ncbi:hypothetical protein GCM10017687_08040 [Streptomyces echinatus]